MISSFFSKTKPINYLATVGFVFIVYWIVILKTINYELNFSLLWPNIGALIFLILTFLAINPIIKDDKLAETSSFAMLFYVLMLLNFSSVLAQDAEHFGRAIMTFVTNLVMFATTLSGVCEPILSQESTVPGFQGVKARRP